MKRLNLSEWAITHRALVLFMIILLGAAGTYSYFNLGRAEDPTFTIKVMVVNVSWPGATATEMQAQVADKIEKKLQELPFLDRVESYSRPGVSFIRVNLSDRTPPAKVKELWYQVRKKVGDIRGNLPAGIVGPSFNDEYGDVYSALYMLSADGLTLAELKTRKISASGCCASPTSIRSTSSANGRSASTSSSAMAASRRSALRRSRSSRA
jgi:multidrug efflux pump subunit AcrB